jgi:hypothetical protein
MDASTLRRHWEMGLQLLYDLNAPNLVVLHPHPAHKDETAFAMAYAAMSPASQIVRASSDPEAVELAKKAVARGLPVVFVDYGKDFLHKLPDGAYVVDHHLRPPGVDRPRATADLAVLIAEENGVKISDFVKQYLEYISLVDIHDSILASLERRQFSVGWSLVVAPYLEGRLLAEAGRILLSMEWSTYVKLAEVAYRKLVEVFRELIDEKDPVKKAAKVDALIEGSQEGFLNPVRPRNVRPVDLISPLDAAAVAAAVRLGNAAVLQKAAEARLESLRGADIGKIQAVKAYLYITPIRWSRPVLYIDRPLELNTRTASQLLSIHRDVAGVVVVNKRDPGSYTAFMRQALPKVEGVALLKEKELALYRVEKRVAVVQQIGLKI